MLRSKIVGVSPAVRWSLLLPVFIGATALANPPALNTAAGVNPADFRYTTFASGLNYPVGMQMLSDGSLLVATSNPITNLYNSTGALVRFTDANHDGVADNPAGTVVYNGLPGTLTALQQAGNLLFVTSSSPSPSITVLKMASPTSYTLVGTEQLGFAPGWEHTTYGSTVQPTPGVPGSYDFYFNIGSQADNVTTPGTTTVSASGLFSGQLHGDSIYRITVTDSANPTFSGLTQIAYGLRNAAGMAFQPGTGNFYLDDNGIDNGINDPTYNNSGKEYSADEINEIPAGQVGVANPDFGFAHDVILESDGSRVGDGAGVPPLQTFRALADGTQSEGPNEIAFAPSAFPAGLNSGIFVTFHGTPDAGTANQQNPLVYYDPATNQYFHFIQGGQDGLGHLDGILSTNDSLFLSDIQSQGSMITVNGTGLGAIYELTAVPEPASLSILAISACVFIPRRNRTK